MIVIVDASWLMYKGIYAYSRFSSDYTGKTLPTGHVYNLVRCASTICADPQVSRVFFTRDLRPKEKIENNPDYKDGRSKSYNVHKDFAPSSALFKHTPRVTFIERKDTEADDLMSVVSRYYAAKGEKVVIFSGDNDMLPLASDPCINISRSFIKGKMDILQSTYWLTTFGVPLKALSVYRTLVGDTSDCIKGIERMPKDLARQIANSLKTFEEFPEKFKYLKDRYGTTESRIKYLYEIRKHYSRLLNNYNVFHNPLNINFPIEEIVETQTDLSFEEAVKIYSFSYKTVELLKAI